MIRPFEEEEENDEKHEEDISKIIKIEKKELDDEDDKFTPDEELCAECDDDNSKIIKWKLMGLTFFFVIVILFSSF